MTGFSKILARPGLLLGARALAQSIKPAAQNQMLAQFVRESHGRTMFIRPGKFYTKKYFDMLHLWFVVAGLPFALLYTYQMVFVGEAPFKYYFIINLLQKINNILYAFFLKGPAKLAEIPEGYEPRYYEYIRVS
jgi:hypothetical protein